MFTVLEPGRDEEPKVGCQAAILREKKAELGREARCRSIYLTNRVAKGMNAGQEISS